jgi:hypothetical protein
LKAKVKQLEWQLRGKEEKKRDKKHKVSDLLSVGKREKQLGAD